MPIAPNPRIRPTRALVIGAIGVAVGIGAIVGIVLFSQSGRVNLGITAGEFRAGQVAILEEQIKTGGPVIYRDPSNSGLNIALSLLDASRPLNESNWTVFLAQRQGCGDLLEWQEESGVLRNPCEPETIINPNGCIDDADKDNQLRHYGVRIERENVIIDLNSPNDGYCK